MNHFTKGFMCFVFTDHQNVERTDSVLRTKRCSKKLLNWSVELMPELGRMRRVWIQGEKNVLADTLSRYAWDDAIAQTLVLPQPEDDSYYAIRAIIDQMFRDPAEFSARCQAMRYWDILLQAPKKVV